jgi:cation transport regulator
MPYKSVDELPNSVRENLPEHAQEIYKEAFNNAWEEYKAPSERRENASLEATAHRIAWSAVKKKYKKEKSGEWVVKDIG